MKNLIKSYKFWTSLAGAIGLLVTAISEHLGIVISAEGVKEIIMAICGILIVFGVVKKPTNKDTTETQEKQTEPKKEISKDK